MRRILLLATVALTGCTNMLAVRQAELTSWIGRPETELVEAMGAPTRSYDAGKVKVLTYEDRRVEITPGGPFYGPGPFGYGYGGGFPPTAETLVCATSFTIDGGVVRSFSFRGNACG